MTADRQLLKVGFLQYHDTRLGDLEKPLRGCDLAESLVHLSDPVVLQVRRLAVPAI